MQLPSPDVLICREKPNCPSEQRDSPHPHPHPAQRPSFLSPWPSSPALRGCLRGPGRPPKVGAVSPDRSLSPARQLETTASRCARPGSAPAAAAVLSPRARGSRGPAAHSQNALERSGHSAQPLPSRPEHSQPSRAPPQAHPLILSPTGRLRPAQGLPPRPAGKGLHHAGCGSTSGHRMTVGPSRQRPLGPSGLLTSSTGQPGAGHLHAHTRFSSGPRKHPLRSTMAARSQISPVSSD